MPRVPDTCLNHVLNVIDGGDKRGQEAVEAAKLTGMDAALAMVDARIDALVGALRVVASDIDRLEGKETHGPAS